MMEPTSYAETGGQIEEGTSLVSRVVAKLGRGVLIQFGLLLAIAGALVYTLSGLVRGLEISQLWPLALLALPAGWWIAARAVPNTRRWNWISLILGALLGLALVVIRTGSLLDETWRLIMALNQAFTAALRWGPGLVPPDFNPAAGILLQILNGSSVLLERSFVWLSALLSSNPGYDPAAVALVWGLAVWLVLFWASWSLGRGLNPLASTSPSLLLLGASMAASNASWAPLAPVLGAALALMGAASYVSRELKWEREQVDFSEELRIDVGLAVLSVAFLLVITAAFTSYFSLQRASDFINRMIPRYSREETPLGESFGLERQPDPGPREPTAAPQTEGVILSLRTGGMPRDHLLGTGPELSKEIVMYIATGEFPPSRPEMIDHGNLPRYYWRSLSYDIYTRRGWVTSQAQVQAYEAGESALTSGLPTQKRVRQMITPAVDLGGLIYSAGDLSSVDQPFEIEWRRQPGADLPPDFFGASLTQPAPGYSAESWYSQASAEALRQAGSSYSEEIAQRYLELPELIPDRVRQLALSLTATEPTPYDRAKAIESYLRQNYTYSLDVQPPPIRQDVVDYFLFDLKAGYCDYYASSMVVLARLSGLPARLAIGYAPGTYNPYEARYAITAADAHSWPEIYFPGYGWIIFEPTVSQSPPEYGLLVGETQLTPEPPARTPSLTSVDWRRLLLWVGIGLASLFSLLIVWLLSDPLRLNLLPPARALDTLYARLEELAPRLGLSLAPGHTPAEFAAAMDAAFQPEPGTKPPYRSVIIEMMTPAPGEAHGITELYARSVFSPHPLQADDKRQALRLWAHLRWRLLLRRVVQRKN